MISVLTNLLPSWTQVGPGAGSGDEAAPRPKSGILAARTVGVRRLSQDMRISGGNFMYDLCFRKISAVCVATGLSIFAGGTQAAPLSTMPSPLPSAAPLVLVHGSHCSYMFGSICSTGTCPARYHNHSYACRRRRTPTSRRHRAKTRICSYRPCYNCRVKYYRCW